MERFVKPRLSSYISYYRATVVTPASNGRMTVKRPFDNPVSLPYVAAVEDLAAGDQCTVFVFGDSSNAIVVGNGSLSVFGSGGGGGGGGGGSPWDSAPLMDGRASPGNSALYARGDHRHPSDTSKANTEDVPASAEIDGNGLISFLSDGGTTLFTLQLPLYGGAVGDYGAIYSQTTPSYTKSGKIAGTVGAIYEETQD